MRIYNFIFSLTVWNGYSVLVFLLFYVLYTLEVSNMEFVKNTEGMFYAISVRKDLTTKYVRQ